MHADHSVLMKSGVWIRFNLSAAYAHTKTPQEEASSCRGTRGLGMFKQTPSGISLGGKLLAHSDWKKDLSFFESECVLCDGNSVSFVGVIVRSLDAILYSAMVFCYPSGLGY